MRIGEFELESPIMNAGGVVKSVEDVRKMAQTGVGAIVAGSYTLEPRVGNSPNGERVYYRDNMIGLTVNSLGMPNAGIEAVAADLPEMLDIAHDAGKPFVLNFAPVSQMPDSEVTALGEVLARNKIDEIDAIELNASCPNVIVPATKPGEINRHEILSHYPDRLAKVLSALGDVMTNEVPVETLIVRIAPFRHRYEAKQLATVMRDAGVNAVAAFNTFPGGKPLTRDGEPYLQVKDNVGGQSGRAMADAAERQTEWLVKARREASAEFDIIGCNGIEDAELMTRRLDIGTAAVGATTIFYESSNWRSTIDGILQDYAG